MPIYDPSGPAMLRPPSSYAKAERTLMSRLLGKFPRVAFYALLVVSLALASGAGRKWS